MYDAHLSHFAYAVIFVQFLILCYEYYGFSHTNRRGHVSSGFRKMAVKTSCRTSFECSPYQI